MRPLMQGWKMILVAGSMLVLAGCTKSPTAPKLSKHADSAKVVECRSGYYVRAGRDSTCVQ